VGPVYAESGTNPSAGTKVTATATCPAGTKILGGGGRSGATVASQERRVSLYESYPSAADAWTATTITDSGMGSGSMATIQVYAVCTA
jgi:hypothetical protein